jgi:hypothetical protein
MRNDLASEIKIGAEATGPPIKYALPLPKDTARCDGCTYPGVGFICWSSDGSCLRTQVEKLSCRSDGG